MADPLLYYLGLMAVTYVQPLYCHYANHHLILVLARFGALQAGNVFSFVPDISSAKGAAEEILRLVDSKPEIDAESTDGLIVEKATGHIELRDIHFRYRQSTNIKRSEC